MFTSSIIDVQLSSNYSLNKIISLGHVTCLYLCAKMLYI